MLTMKRLAVLGVVLLSVLVALPSAAQQANWAEVIFESAFIRAQPIESAEAVGSVFQGESVRVIGRNATATWWEVSRDGRTSIGWINGFVVNEFFDSWAVPITSSAGIEGSTAVEETGFSAYILANTVLRADPLTSGEQLGIVPFDVTVPVLGRNQDGSWLYVNYNGFLGWIATPQARPSGSINALPLGYDLPPLPFNVVVSPVETQLAQLERMRGFINDQRNTAAVLAAYWYSVYRGDTMPCDAMPVQPIFIATPDDIRQLPEMQRYLVRLEEAISSLNASIAPLMECGVFFPDELLEARNGAINAGVIFDATLDSLENVEDTILRR
jgi:hypothetical protein